MNPGRILLLNHNVREHGTYFRARKVAAEFQRRGWQTLLVTTGTRWYRPQRSRDADVAVLETPSWSLVHHPDEGWSPLGLLARLPESLRRYDIVYSFSHHPVDQIPSRLARARGAFWVCDWCDLYGGDGINAMNRTGRGTPASWRHRLHDRLDGWDNRLEDSAARECDLLTVIGGFLERRAASLGRPSERTLRMPSGAELEEIRPQSREESRRRLNLAPEALFLGYIANYHPDQELLLETLRRVREQRPGVQLLAAGNPLYATDVELAARGLGGAIVSVGRVPFEQLQFVLGACDVLLVPMTDTEFNRSRWPHKLGDYMAAGRPMACTRVGDVTEFIDRHGVAVGAEANAADYARAIVALLDDPVRRERLGREARALAERAFTWSAQVDALLERVELLKASSGR